VACSALLHDDTDALGLFGCVEAMPKALVISIPKAETVVTVTTGTATQSGSNDAMPSYC
jgi:hypothetical protein